VRILLARINLWTFSLPGLKNRSEDIEPNLDFELDRFAEKAGRRVTFSKEARDTFLAFALSPTANWSGNFRDLNAAVARMATLAPGGRISIDITEEEIKRLLASWSALANRLLQSVFKNSLMTGVGRTGPLRSRPNSPSSWMCAGAVARCRTPVVHYSAHRERARPSQMMRTGSASIWHDLGLSFQESSNSLESKFEQS